MGKLLCIALIKVDFDGEKQLLCIALIKVDVDGEKQAAWRYVAKSCVFLSILKPMLRECCVGAGYEIFEF